MRNILFGFAAAILGLILLLAVLEAGVRLFLPPYLWVFRDATSDWQLDGRLGWVNKPNLDIKFQPYGGGVAHFQTNRDGLIPRTARRQKDPDI